MAGMFSGYLQAAAYKNLNGVLGHEGWQWLYIICGIISLPIGIIGYFFNPDVPENSRAFYLTTEEISLARERLLRNGYKPLGASASDKTKIFRIMKQWQFWALPLGYFLVQSSFPSAQPALALYLKATQRPVHQIKHLAYRTISHRGGCPNRSRHALRFSTPERPTLASHHFHASGYFHWCWHNCGVERPRGCQILCILYFVRVCRRALNLLFMVPRADAT